MTEPELMALRRMARRRGVLLQWAVEDRQRRAWGGQFRVLTCTGRKTLLATDNEDTLREFLSR